MKKIIYIVCLSLGLVSCSDFLDEKLKYEYGSDNIFKSEEQARGTLTGVYNAAATSVNLWKVGDVASDDAVKGGNPGDQADLGRIEDFSADRANGVLYELWKNTYETINRANNVISGIVSTPMDQTLKNQYIGEAKFLRAYSYFQLVNIFGKVPLKLIPQQETGGIHVPFSEVSAIYTQIEKDLGDAAGALPKEYASNNLGRVTKGAAYGLLAKVQLYQKKYTAALENIQLLEGLGVYDLDDYANLFKLGNENSKESVFAIRFMSDQTPVCSNPLNQWLAPADENGYYMDAPTQNYVDCFTEKQISGEEDPRIDLSIGRDGKPWLNDNLFSASWSETGYLVKKHNQPLTEVPLGTKGDGGMSYIYLRYADILLMKAECLNETHQPSLAEIELNQVRNRSGLSSVSGNGENSVRELIRTERRRELGFEFHRFFDLMRWGKEVATAALGENFKWTEPRFYFPVPQGEYDSNQGIK